MIPQEQIKAIFITHSHSDHIKGLRVLLKKIKVPVYASKATLGYLELQNTFSKDDKYFDIEGNAAPNLDMKVDFFKTSHDCEGSGGYTVTLSGGDKVSLCTDLGIITDDIRKKLIGSKAVIIESNHDVGMLQNGPYPFVTKQRILSDEGHLSNVACAGELSGLVSAGATNIVLAHLSRDNNTPDLARVTATSVLMEKSMILDKDYRLYIAPRSGGRMIYSEK